MTYHAQIQDLAGFAPGCDPLVYAVDLAGHFELERLQRLALEGWDGNAAVWIKLTEGQAPSVKEQAKAEIIYQGALACALRCDHDSKPFGFYHYATPLHNGAERLDDVVFEAQWFLTQLVRIRTALRAHSAKMPSLKPWLDLEDKHTPATRTQLNEWCLEWLDYVKDEEGHDSAVYTSAHYVEKFLGAHHGLGEFQLIQADYDNNDPDRDLVAPELPHGWRYRAGWQFTEIYRGSSRPKRGLDRNVVRLSALEI